MAKNNVAKSRPSGEQPVSRQIKRAAKRAGIRAVEAPAEELDRTDEELDVLRDLAAKAGLIFEHNGEVSNDPTGILREALRSASDDLDLLAQASVSPCGVEGGTMPFLRASYRIELALALFEYRQEFGYVESVEGEQAAGRVS